MLLVAVQCKENGKKTLHRSTDRGGLEWILRAINRNNERGLRTLVLIKE
jgi:hypothetical protein